MIPVQSLSIVVTNQIVTIKHEIYFSFDNKVEVKIVFLAMYKALGKVWHEEMLIRVSGNLSKLLKTS